MPLMPSQTSATDSGLTINWPSDMLEAVASTPTNNSPPAVMSVVWNSDRRSDVFNIASVLVRELAVDRCEREARTNRGAVDSRLPPERESFGSPVRPDGAVPRVAGI